MSYQFNAPSQDVCPPDVLLGVLALVGQELEGVRHHQAPVQLPVRNVVLNALQRKSNFRAIMAQQKKEVKLQFQIKN